MTCLNRHAFVARCYTSVSVEVDSLPPLLDGIADSIPNRRGRQVPIQPNPDCLTDQIALGNEADFFVTAVSAVVAIVAHEEIMSRRHDRVVLGRRPPRYV